MSNCVKDPAIKLFGKTIQLAPDDSLAENLAASEDHDQTHPAITSLDDKKPSGGELAEITHEDASTGSVRKELTVPATSSGISEGPEFVPPEKETSSEKSDNEQDLNDQKGTSQDKTLKKPDKILPCPRCNSMDTKFCYYNNYNVNQPRHFCKNCQRYWTAGGTMRNVPVGSGRRKNKSSSNSYYRRIIVSEALQLAHGDAANGIHYGNLKPNGTMLTFGSDNLLCESMAAALNIAGKSHNNFVQNGFHGHEQKLPMACKVRNNVEDHSTGSSSTASDSTEKSGMIGVHGSSVHQSFPSQLPIFPGPSQPCTWDTGQWRPSMNLQPFKPNIPISFCPFPPYWGCSVPASWNMPWVTTSPSSPNSPTLGKHSRDGNILNSSSPAKQKISQVKDSQQPVHLHKTLRTDESDDPSEAAKSSIWSKPGIKNKKDHQSNMGNIFNTFQTKGNEKNHSVETSLLLQANPAALSRSLTFHEST